MIGELLKLERQKAGISQKELAIRSKVSFVSVNRIERGQSPRISIVTKLFEALNKKLIFSVDELQQVNELPEVVTTGA